MKYRLKDKELQKKLDELSDGDFTRKLEENSKRYAYEFDQYGKNVTVRVQFGEKALHSERFNVLLGIDDVEQIQEYDPHAWNKYPSVTPPEGVWMRIECVETDESGIPELIGIRSRYIRSYVTGEFQWTGIDGEWLDDYYKVVRFRPWED